MGVSCAIMFSLSLLVSVAVLGICLSVGSLHTGVLSSAYDSCFSC